MKELVRPCATGPSGDSHNSKMSSSWCRGLTCTTFVNGAVQRPSALGVNFILTTNCRIKYPSHLPPYPWKGEGNQCDLKLFLAASSCTGKRGYLSPHALLSLLTSQVTKRIMNLMAFLHSHDGAICSIQCIACGQI